MRSYNMMRHVLSVASRADRTLIFDDFLTTDNQALIPAELRRLCDDGLLDGSVSLDKFGVCRKCEVHGLTAEGGEFYRLIDNDSVWSIVSETLSAAGVDVLYPLLKEICEEIVKRYVVSFIPEIIR